MDDILFGVCIGALATISLLAVVWFGGILALNDTTSKCKDIGSFVYKEITYECREVSK